MTDTKKREVLSGGAATNTNGVVVVVDEAIENKRPRKTAWLSYTGTRNTRVGGAYQVTLLPPPTLSRTSDEDKKVDSCHEESQQQPASTTATGPAAVVAAEKRSLRIQNKQQHQQE